MANHGWFPAGFGDPTWSALGWFDPDFIATATGPTTYTITPAGSVVPVGLLVRWPTRTLVGAVGPSGLLTKQLTRALTSAVGLSGLVSKQTIRAFTGFVPSAGVLTKLLTRALTGTVSLSGSLARWMIKPLTGSVPSAGALIRVLTRVFTGTLGSAGALLKFVTTVKTGTVGLVGSLLKQLPRSMSGVIGSTSVVTNQLAQTITAFGTVASSGLLLRWPSRILVGTVPSSGVVIRVVSRLVVATVTPVGGLIRQLTRLLTGVIGSSGTYTDQLVQIRDFAGVVALAGQITRAITRGLTGVVPSTGLLVRMPILVWTALVALSGSLVVGLSQIRTFVGTVGVTGAALAWQVTRLCTGAITLIGDLVVDAGASVVLISRSIPLLGLLRRAPAKQLDGFVSADGLLTTRSSPTLLVTGVLLPIGKVVKVVAIQTCVGTVVIAGSVIATMIGVAVIGTITLIHKALGYAGIEGRRLGGPDGLGHKTLS